MTVVSQQRVDYINNRLAEKSLYHFVKQAWTVIDPRPFKDRWDTRAICDHLEAVHRGEINRLIITIPPGRGKSLLGAVFYPAWVWLTKPECRFLTGTSRDDLTTRDNVRCRDLINSPFYQNLLHFLHGKEAYTLKGDQDQKHKYYNNKLGWRLAFSTEGGITGDRGDMIILDDPLDIRKAHVRNHTEKLEKWMREGMATRLDGWEEGKGSIIVIMQRLHANDPVKFLLEQDTWTHLKIPMEFKAEKAKSTIYFKDPREEENELLDGTGIEVVAAKKKEVGIFAWETQYNQEPSKEEGNIIHVEKFKTYKENETIKYHLKLQSWDTAFKKEQRNDYSVGIDFGVVISNAVVNIFIRNIYRERKESPELKRDIRMLKKIYKPDIIVMEDKASGQTLIPELQRHDGVNEPIFIHPVKPVGDKVARANSVAPIIDAGCIFVPEYAPWLADFLAECSDFPDVTHDDQVDAFTQGVLQIINNKSLTRRGLYE